MKPLIMMGMTTGDTDSRARSVQCQHVKFQISLRCSNVDVEGVYGLEIEEGH